MRVVSIEDILVSVPDALNEEFERAVAKRLANAKAAGENLGWGWIEPRKRGRQP